MVRSNGRSSGDARGLATSAVATGPIIYYRDPDGSRFFSAAPKKNAAGKDYVPVRASEDVSFDEKPCAAA